MAVNKSIGKEKVMKTEKPNTLKNKKSFLYRYFIFLFGLAASMIVQFVSCTEQTQNTVIPERAIYYWKSSSYISDYENNLCDSLGIKKIYIKFFEVNYNEERGSFPESKAEWREYYNTSQKFNEVVPTVYFRNVVFLKSSREELDLLVDNVNFLINKFCKERLWDGVEVNEYQMDCDWTPKSKDNYFYFLNKLKGLSGKKISCTLRLYPYKYRNKMGVPPVDKVTLMCYNLINPLENPNKNSILDLSELESYLKVSEKYPKHLDIALPVYSWAMVFHNERFSDVLYTNIKQLKKILKKEKPLWYSITRDTVINNIYLRVGDNIKLEEIDISKVKGAIALLKENIDFDKNTTIALFSLDEELINNFTNEELSSIFDDFSK